MLSYLIHNAALDLKGKPPEELPHGLLVVPPEVREIVAEERGKHSPEAFAPYQALRLCAETVGWYFDGLGHEVMYRPTPEGPEVLAVGADETITLRKSVPLESRRDVKTYLGY